MPAKTHIPLNQRHCIACAHYRVRKIGGKVLHMCRGHTDRITGEVIETACQTQRSNTYGKCKKAGRLFVPRVKTEAAE